MRSLRFLKSLSLTLMLLVTAGCANEGPEQWADDVRAFEVADRTEPPRAGGIVFVGGSSIRLWDLAKYFPDIVATGSTPLINRALGGSRMSDSVYYADRIILPYRPRTVVVYAGDNDLARGKSPTRVRDEFAKLAAVVHARLPLAKIVYISITPGIARGNLVDRMRKTNRLVRELTFESGLLDYVDIDGPMTGSNGEPQPHLFMEDGVHLSEAGYRLWAELLRPHLVPVALARGRGVDRVPRPVWCGAGE